MACGRVLGMSGGAADRAARTVCAEDCPAIVAECGRPWSCCGSVRRSEDGRQRAAALRCSFIFLLGGAVMAGPGEEKAAAAADRGHLRASHADREQVIDTLKAAFVQGRLTKDEFDARIGQAFASRAYAELVPV